MATKKVVWLDSSGTAHSTEEAAVRGDKIDSLVDEIVSAGLVSEGRVGLYDIAEFIVDRTPAPTTNRADTIDRMQAWINQATDLLQAYRGDLRAICYTENGPAVEDVNNMEILDELLADDHPNPGLREG